jgi:hypothetical protein
MADPDTAPLDSDADLERAVAEATDILEETPKRDTPEDRRLGRLLSQIAEFHDSQPEPQQIAHLNRLQELERQLRAYGRQWPKFDRDGGARHWSPTLGSDLDPDHVAHRPRH